MRCLYSLTWFVYDWWFSSLLLTGLKNREFDVCPGTVATVDRTEAGAAFTLPFLDTQARFQVIPGNPRGFDPSNVEGKTIGMLTCILNINPQSNLTLHQKRLTIYSSWTMVVCFKNCIFPCSSWRCVIHEWGVFAQAWTERSHSSCRQQYKRSYQNDSQRNSMWI